MPLTCLSVAAALFGAGCAAYAQQADVDALVRELSGEAEAKTRTAAELEAACGAVIDALLPGMGAQKIEDREQPQRTFERICLHTTRPGAAAERTAMCRSILPRLDVDKPQPARIWMIRQLEYIGEGECVETLARLLSDNDPLVRESARRALQRNPAPAAAAPLREALQRSRDAAWRAALINALAARRDAASVDQLAQLVYAAERPVSDAAIAALADLGGDLALDGLFALFGSDDAPRRDAAAAGLLRLADRLLDEGQQEKSAHIFLSLYSSTRLGEPARVAALRGLVAARQERALPQLLAGIRGDDPARRLRAVRLAQAIPGEGVTKALLDELPLAPEETQALLVDALAARGDAAAKPAILDALRSDYERVRVAALRGLEQLGDADDLVLLATSAAAGGQAERDAARRTLARLRGGQIDERLIVLVGEPFGPLVRAEMIRALPERHCRQAVGTLLETATDADEAVRVASYLALGKLAGEANLPAMVERVVAEVTPAGREEAANAVVAVCLRIDDRERRAVPVLSALAGASGPAKAGLLSVLGRIQGDRALAAIRAALKETDADVRDAAVRAICNWEAPVVLDDLRALAGAGANATHATLALRAYVRLVRKPSDRSAAATAALLQEAMQLARQDDERKLVLGGLAEVPHADALALARSCLSSEGLRDEAALAVISVARNLAAEDRERSIAAIEQVRAAPVGEAARKTADEATDLIRRFQGYVSTWLVAGPYSEEGKRAKELFDAELPPEQDDAGIEWRPLSGAASPGNPWIFDFTKLDSGSNRCVFVQAQVFSPSEQPARLDVGSDDGVKVWLNGQLVHSHYAVRPVNPAEDKVHVALRSGWNTLQLKIVQGGGGWGVCCGVRAPDGGTLEGLKFKAE